MWKYFFYFCMYDAGLLDLANAYCEPHLKRFCEHIIKQGITVDNSSMLYAAAIKYEAPSLQEFCFRFILNHMTAVTQTESFMHLDEVVTKNLIRLAAQFGAFKFWVLIYLPVVGVSVSRFFFRFQFGQVVPKYRILIFVFDFVSNEFHSFIAKVFPSAEQYYSLCDWNVKRKKSWFILKSVKNLNAQVHIVHSVCSNVTFSCSECELVFTTWISKSNLVRPLRLVFIASRSHFTLLYIHFKLDISFDQAHIYHISCPFVKQKVNSICSSYWKWTIVFVAYGYLSTVYSSFVHFSVEERWLMAVCQVNKSWAKVNLHYILSHVLTSIYNFMALHIF